MEEDNKYWLQEGKKNCVFCRKGIAREWFTGLDKNEEDKKDLINLIKIRKE